MDERQRRELVDIMREAIQFDRAMSEYTTFRIGGKADALCFTRDMDALRQVVAFLNNENISYLVIGKGSNLLVKDGGFKGVIIILRGKLASIEQHERNDQILVAGGGLGLGDLMKHCSRNGFGGLEFLSGIPGTVGGAVTMNAGAFGKDMGSVVQEIQVLTPQGELASRMHAELVFSYRALSILEGTIVVSANLKFTRETPEIVSKRVADYLARRKATQPLEYPSAGSVFKNPPNDYAGRLIEEAGLKGERVGGAMISTKHANYIVNRGGASAEDVLTLLNLAKEKVRAVMGIELEPEIRVVGVNG